MSAESVTRTRASLSSLSTVPAAGHGHAGESTEFSELGFRNRYWASLAVRVTLLEVGIAATACVPAWQCRRVPPRRAAGGPAARGARIKFPAQHGVQEGHTGDVDIGNKNCFTL